MAKINDWTILGTQNGKTAIYVSENGGNVLVKYENRDLAEIQSAGINIVIKPSSSQIVIDEINKTITVVPQH